MKRLSDIALYLLALMLMLLLSSCRTKQTIARSEVDSTRTVRLTMADITSTNIDFTFDSMLIVYPDTAPSAAPKAIKIKGGRIAQQTTTASVAEQSDSTTLHKVDVVEEVTKAPRPPIWRRCIFPPVFILLLFAIIAFRRKIV